MATIEHISVHKAGNKQLDETLYISKQPLKADDNLKTLLSDFFLRAFKTEEYYSFQHDTSLDLNEVYTYVKAIFENPEQLHEQSINLVKHLYNQSVHPKIKGGEFYVVYFKDCHLDGVEMDAVGLFKTENKDTYLEVEAILDGIEVESREGININKLDKGCLIYNHEKEKGYVLSIVDNVNKGTEAQYWKDDFLHVLIQNNDFHQTNQFMGIAKNFVTKQLTEDFDMSKAEQIDYLNRSVEYFKTHDTFDKQQFEEEVFYHENVIESFRRFDEHYRNEHVMEVADNFDISAQAVKKQARIFKSVLKLDKNFHIYIHGNRDMIEQGVDENGRKFYKIYFEHES